MVSCQDKITIETNAAVTVTVFRRIDVAVSVSTVRTPATSLARRDWIAPVLVAVKNASSIFCRCANRSPLRSAIAELPIVDVSQFWPIPITAVMSGIRHMKPNSHHNRPMSVRLCGGKSALSKTALVRNGTIEVRVADTTTAAATMTILPR